MLRTSESLDLLPNRLTCNGLVDFMRVDSRADVIGDIVLQSDVAKKPPVFNLVNPRPVSFESLLPSIVQHTTACGGNFKVVTMQEWLAALRAKNISDPRVVESFPALKLLGFFEGIAGSIQRGDAEGSIDTKNAPKVSEAMRELQAVRGHDVAG